MFSVKYEDKFDEAAVSSIKPGETVWDIGANIGFFTLKFANAVTSTGTVVAFEPAPSTFVEITKAVEGLPNVQLENMALGDFDGETDFYIADLETNPSNGLFATSFTKAAQVTKVRVMKGDTFLASSPQLAPNRIKIDVEGFEFEVLFGLSETLKRASTRAVFVEVHFTILKERGLPENPTKITKLLKESGFKVNWVDPSHIVASKS